MELKRPVQTLAAKSGRQAVLEFLAFGGMSPLWQHQVTSPVWFYGDLTRPGSGIEWLDVADPLQIWNIAGKSDYGVYRKNELQKRLNYWHKHVRELVAADLAALADICLVLVEAKVEDEATLPETAMQAKVECVALALAMLSASADGKSTAKVMCGDFQSGGVAYLDLAQTTAEAQGFGSYGEWISTLKEEVDVALSQLKPEEEKSGYASEQQNQKRPKESPDREDKKCSKKKKQQHAKRQDKGAKEGKKGEDGNGDGQGQAAGPL